MQSDKPGKAPVIPLSGKTYELSFLIRNTYRCGQALRTWVAGKGPDRREGQTKIRGWPSLLGALMHRPNRPACPPGPKQKQERQPAQQHETAVQVDPGKREHARLDGDLTVEDGERLLLRGHWIYSL
jgi:hypothetical protein